MRPKNMVAIKTEADYNIKQQKRLVPNLEGMTRNTVLVNNLSAQPPRGVISNTRVITQRMNQDIRCKRKISFVPGQTYPGTQPASVARRNARERNRVKQVNNGFATLRSHIPPSVAAALTTEKPSARNASNKKLSKVETLKMAVEYIRSLQDMLDESKKDHQYNNENYEEDYYSSSPEGSRVTSQPEMVLQQEYYSRYQKSEPDDFYSKRFPKPEPDDYGIEFYDETSQGSPKLESPKQFRQYDKNPNGTITILNGPNYHAFVPPRQRNSTSLSPPISEACPSPTPSYASDNSSIHTTSSGQVTSAFSRLTTTYVPENYPSPVNKIHHSPVRQASPNSIVSSTVPSSASPGYTNVEFQKNSPDYENYEPMSPEDEELLDVISWWQQSH